MMLSEIFPLPHQEPWDNYTNSLFNLQKKDFKPYSLLEDVDILGDTSLVSFSNGDIVEDAIDEALYWQPRPFPFQHLRTDDIAKVLIEERKNCLSGLKEFYYKHYSDNVFIHEEAIGIYLCHPFGFYAYGHLHDSLQRLYSVRHLPPDSRYRLVVSSYERVTNFLEHISALLGKTLSDQDLILVSPKEIHRFEQLIVPFSPAIPTSYTSDTYDWLFTSYINEFVEDPFSPTDKNLYLSRNHVTPGARSVTNEEEVRGLLEENNFKVVYGNEPLRDIISLFYSAKTVVGCHGSLFANTAFCRPGTKIIEYCPANRIDFSFRNKYKYAQDYAHCLVGADEKYNIAIPVDDLFSRL